MTRGQIAYEAYRKLRGTETWRQLRQAERDAWEAAADAAYESGVDDGMVSRKTPTARGPVSR